MCSPNCRERELWLLEEQPRSWLRGNPWQCDFNLKSQISMPGTQAARALGAAPCLLTAHTARAGFLTHQAPTPLRPPPRGLDFTLWAVTWSPRDLALKSIRLYAALECEVKNATSGCLCAVCCLHPWGGRREGHARAPRIHLHGSGTGRVPRKGPTLDHPENSQQGTESRGACSGSP